jgi:hypothetical protein
MGELRACGYLVHPHSLSEGHCALAQYRLFYTASRGLREVKYRRDGRAVEGARLESVYTATYQGFESLSLRHVMR